MEQEVIIPVSDQTMTDYKEMLPETKENNTEVPVQMDPAEEAAMKFTKLLPYVKMLGSAVPSQKGIVRVLHALAEFPLGKEKPRLLTEGERQLFHVIQELQGYKSTVIQNILQQNAELEKLKQTAVTELPVAAETEVVNV